MKHTIIHNSTHILEFDSKDCNMKIILTNDEFNKLVQHVRYWLNDRKTCVKQCGNTEPTPDGTFCMNCGSGII